MEHGCIKESTVAVQHKVNNVILTPKEKRALRNKRHRLRKKNVEDDVEKERQRMREFYDKDNNAEKIKRNLEQLYKNNTEPKKQKMNKYYADEVDLTEQEQQETM